MFSPKRFVSKARNGERAISGKGHFVVYTADQNRFEVPLAYLNNAIFQELLKVAEDEFGLSGNGRITVPCNADFLDYVLSFIRRRPSKDTEKALLLTIFSSRCSISSLHQSEHRAHQIPLHSY
ncbi:auxin-responsive protein SAUR65-like [Aristolochia californica]|uniref:auxin-responsive protein SAUR65-like n=1 Tax=Aristolochia californica TaxID=171875 RepID=UPI0035D9ACD8